MWRFAGCRELTAEEGLGEENEDVEQEGVAQQHADAHPAPPVLLEEAPAVQHRQPHRGVAIRDLPPRCTPLSQRQSSWPAFSCSNPACTRALAQEQKSTDRAKQHNKQCSLERNASCKE